MPDEVDLEVDRMIKEVELREVRCYELSARARAGFTSDKSHDEPEDLPADLNVQVKRKKDTLGIRIRAKLVSADAEILVDFASFYDISDSAQYSSDAVTRFVSRDGVFTLFPFIREGIAEMSRRVGVEPHILSLLRPGQVESAVQVDQHEIS